MALRWNPGRWDQSPAAAVSAIANDLLLEATRRCTPLPEIFAQLVTASRAAAGVNGGQLNLAAVVTQLRRDLEEHSVALATSYVLSLGAELSAEDREIVRESCSAEHGMDESQGSAHRAGPPHSRAPDLDCFGSSVCRLDGAGAAAAPTPQPRVNGGGGPGTASDQGTDIIVHAYVEHLVQTDPSSLG